MASAITVDDRAFMAGFANLTQRDRQNSQAGMRRYGTAVIAFAHTHIHVVSRELSDSLKVEERMQGDQPSIEVGAFEDGAADPHGLYEEFGTSKELPHPFMRPALIEAEGAFTVDP